MFGDSAIRQWAAIALTAIIVLGMGVAAFAWSTSKEHPAAQAEPVESPAPAEPAPTATPVLSAEEQARADLDALVRAYEEAENSAFLDPSLDPTATLQPYLADSALTARVEHLLSFRDAGHRIETGGVTVQSIRVTALDFDAEPPVAVLEECRTLVASGIDGPSGEPVTHSSTRVVQWTASQTPTGEWRLSSYEGKGKGSC